jgi:hypothetical protein
VTANHLDFDAQLAPQPGRHPGGMQPGDSVGAIPHGDPAHDDLPREGLGVARIGPGGRPDGVPGAIRFPGRNYWGWRVRRARCLGSHVSDRPPRVAGEDAPEQPLELGVPGQRLQTLRIAQAGFGIGLASGRLSRVVEHSSVCGLVEGSVLLNVASSPCKNRGLVTESP